MKLYTKAGDNGTTSLYGGKIVLKSNHQIEIYGTIDELSSFTGLVIAKTKDENIKELLIKIQKDLYQIMAIIAIKQLEINQIDSSQVKRNSLEIRVNEFEKIIDNFEKKLPRLNRFILPTGTEMSCWFHILRAICRRTERKVIKYFKKPASRQNCNLVKKLNEVIIKYFNRLSDLFFILARSYNQNKEIVT